jgi:asparagine synthase (glutamine-hydrolysing)
MCGIVGQIYRDPERRVEPASLATMCAALVHRGPDDQGAYCVGNVGLAMRRLAIIDVNTGQQPIHNEDATVWTVYNGEIYNFRELRRELESRGHAFYTQTDTEVLVHLYEDHGVDFVRRLNGMFAIALWDVRKRRLVLARDHIGIKPLFYADLGDRFVFGSEIKALLADGWSPSVDVTALSHYLSLLYVPAPFTIYREIRKLEPAHILTWQAGEVTVRRYWHLHEAAGVARSEPTDVASTVRDLLADAVRRQLIADVPLGAFLSGGLDSSTVVALMRRAHTGRIKTFAIGFDDPSYDERPAARIVAKAFETDHTEFNVRANVQEILPRIAYHFDEPFADASAIPTYYLSQLTRQHVKVALGGDGGDEVFAGYLTYRAEKLASIYRALPAILSRRVLPALVHRLPVSDRKISFEFRAKRFVDHALIERGRRHFAWKAFFDEELKREILSDDITASIDGAIDSYPILHRFHQEVGVSTGLNALLYGDVKLSLADDILVKVDRMSMAHSLEVRVPLLDHRLVEFMFALPGARKMPGLRLKHVLKQAMRDVLPPAILRRRKAGFNVPLSSWLRKELRPLVRELLSAEQLATHGVFKPRAVQRLVSDHLTGRADYSRNLWALLMFGLWYEQRSSRAPAPLAALR